VWTQIFFEGGTSSDFDLFNLEDIVNGPYDAEETADNDDNDFEGIAPGGTTASAAHLLVDLSSMNDVHRWICCCKLKLIWCFIESNKNTEYQYSRTKINCINTSPLQTIQP
jgi:hypothetical protein